MVRLEEILNAPEKIEDKPDAVKMKNFNKNIELRNVTFMYDDVDVLKNINLMRSASHRPSIHPCIIQPVV